MVVLRVLFRVVVLFVDILIMRRSLFLRGMCMMMLCFFLVILSGLLFVCGFMVVMCIFLMSVGCSCDLVWLFFCITFVFFKFGCAVVF